MSRADWVRGVQKERGLGDGQDAGARAKEVARYLMKRVEDGTLPEDVLEDEQRTRTIDPKKLSSNPEFDKANYTRACMVCGKSYMDKQVLACNECSTAAVPGLLNGAIKFTAALRK